jgi:hypothetical protein
MTIVTTADSKKKSHVKPMEPKSKEQCAQDKSDTVARKQKLKVGIASAIECHGSKGPWLEVSFNVTCSAQVLSVVHKWRRGCTRREE